MKLKPVLVNKFLLKYKIDQAFSDIKIVNALAALSQNECKTLLIGQMNDWIE